MEDITLLEFQELAINRLRVLKAVEQVKDRFPRGTEAINDELSKVSRQLWAEVILSTLLNFCYLIIEAYQPNTLAATMNIMK